MMGRRPSQSNQSGACQCRAWEAPATRGAHVARASGRVLCGVGVGAAAAGTAEAIAETQQLSLHSSARPLCVNAPLDCFPGAMAGEGRGHCRSRRPGPGGRSESGARASHLSNFPSGRAPLARRGRSAPRPRPVHGISPSDHAPSMKRFRTRAASKKRRNGAVATRPAPGSRARWPKPCNSSTCGTAATSGWPRRGCSTF